MNRKPKDWRNELYVWMAERGLRANERWLYQILADHWNPGWGFAFPGIERLAYFTGWNVRTVERTLMRLQEREWNGAPILSVELGGGTGRTNRYFLAFFSHHYRLEGLGRTPAFCRGSDPRRDPGDGRSEETPAFCPPNPGIVSENPGILSGNPGTLPGDPLGIRESDPREGSFRSIAGSHFKNQDHSERRAKKENVLSSKEAVSAVLDGILRRRVTPITMTPAETEDRRRLLRDQAEQLKRREAGGK